MFGIRKFDHVGLRASDLEISQDFYGRLGFKPAAEESPGDKALGLVNPNGVRIHLIYNGTRDAAGNVLMDVAIKRPGYTHAAFVVDDIDALVRGLVTEGIAVTEGPSIFGQRRRKICFIRDPDRNVLEFSEIP